MNSENIKALIELFGNLGTSSKEMFLWYMAYQFFFPCLICGFCLLIFYRVLAEIRQNHARYRALKRLQEWSGLKGDYIEFSCDLKVLVERIIEKGETKVDYDCPSKQFEIDRLRNLLNRIRAMTNIPISSDHQVNIKSIRVLAELAIPPQ